RFDPGTSNADLDVNGSVAAATSAPLDRHRSWKRTVCGLAIGRTGNRRARKRTAMWVPLRCSFTAKCSAWMARVTLKTHRARHVRRARERTIQVVALLCLWVLALGRLRRLTVRFAHDVDLRRHVLAITVLVRRFHFGAFTNVREGGLPPFDEDLGRIRHLELFAENSERPRGHFEVACAGLHLLDRALDRAATHLVGRMRGGGSCRAAWRWHGPLGLSHCGPGYHGETERCESTEAYREFR